jgi:hypothetical protein
MVHVGFVSGREYNLRVRSYNVASDGRVPSCRCAEIGRGLKSDIDSTLDESVLKSKWSLADLNHLAREGGYVDVPNHGAVIKSYRGGSRPRSALLASRGIGGDVAGLEGNELPIAVEVPLVTISSASPSALSVCPAPCPLSSL